MGLDIRDKMHFSWIKSNPFLNSGYEKSCIKKKEIIYILIYQKELSTSHCYLKIPSNKRQLLFSMSINMFPLLHCTKVSVKKKYIYHGVYTFELPNKSILVMELQ